jgi:hypothetical protein
MKVGPLPFRNAADRHILSLVPWDLIGALSFKTERFSEGQQVAFFENALKKLSQVLGVRYQDVVWALKLEYGRWERPHFHFVAAHLFPPQAICETAKVVTCELFKCLWFKKGGGREASVEIYDPKKSGLDYITKRPSLRPANAVRSTAKFGVNGEDMLFSQNLVRLATHKPSPCPHTLL